MKEISIDYKSGSEAYVFYCPFCGKRYVLPDPDCCDHFLYAYEDVNSRSLGMPAEAYDKVRDVLLSLPEEAFPESFQEVMEEYEPSDEEDIECDARSEAVDSYLEEGMNVEDFLQIIGSSELKPWLEKIVVAATEEDEDGLGRTSYVLMGEESEASHLQNLEFTVTLCLGDGDGGDVRVEVPVTDDEYELLKQCCREDDNIDGYEGLEDLCERIKDEAQGENDFCMEDYDDEDEDDEDEENEDDIDYEDVSFYIEMPDEIYDEVQNEDEEINMDDYYGYDFAMEIVNGEIISLSDELQGEMRSRLAAKLNVSEEELLAYLDEESENEDERFADLPYFDDGVLGCLICGGGIGFLDCKYGWQAKELLEYLGFRVDENINYGPHGHGSYGVYYIETFKKAEQ